MKLDEITLKKMNELILDSSTALELSIYMNEYLEKTRFNNEEKRLILKDAINCKRGIRC